MIFNPNRLQWIRKKRGINKTKLAKLIGVDLRTITGYESGQQNPSDGNIRKLISTLNVTHDFFAMEDIAAPEVVQVSFRSLSKLSAAKRDMALASGAVAFALTSLLEEKFHLPKPDIPDYRELYSPEEAAVCLRTEWHLGNQPISNMVHLLESKGIRVFSLALNMKEVDAFCTWNDDKPFIFLNTKKSNARRRFDAAHELGHLLLHKHGDYSGKVTEREADAFASAFLMPRDGVLPTRPAFFDLRSLIQHKKNWGVSVAAYLVRMHKLNQVSDWQYRTLFKQLSQRGYRRSEPDDHPQERSKLLELLLKELRNDGIQLSNVAKQLGYSRNDVAELFFDLALVSVGGTGTTKNNSKPSVKLTLIVDNDE